MSDCVVFDMQITQNCLQKRSSMSEIQTYRVHNPHSLKTNKVRSYETKPFTILKYVEGPCNRHFDLIDLSRVSFVSSSV